jgi:hypothetical protein
MKVTFNLSFLLCISGVAIPVVDARTNGFGLHKRSAALKSPATKRSIKHVKAYDFAAHQQRRGLQTVDDSCESSLEKLGTNPCTCDDQGEIDISATECADFVAGLDLVFCEAYLEALGTNPCTCDDQGKVDTSAECEAFIANLEVGFCEAYLEALGPNPCTCDDQGGVDISNAECSAYIDSCRTCDTLQGERTCYVFEEEKSSAGSSNVVEAFCYTYMSGVFDNTICEIEKFAAGTCTITIDGTECNSCAPVTCDGEFIEIGFDFDCSNIIEGETWNQCTDDIPETSRFLATANNDRFIDDDIECPSGAFALSFHALSMVGLIVFATFW